MVVGGGGRRNGNDIKGREGAHGRIKSWGKIKRGEIYDYDNYNYKQGRP